MKVVKGHWQNILAHCFFVTLGMSICKIHDFDVPNPFRKTEGENKENVAFS